MESFPTIGADGPCSVHVNLGQAGFVFVEANVKKWGLAPSVGTLAPPPAYGSERGSILLDVGGRRRSSRDRSPSGTPGTSSLLPLVEHIAPDDLGLTTLRLRLDHHLLMLQALTRSDHRRTGSSGSQTPSSETLGDGNRLNSSESLSRRDPPAYSPLDAFTYADGVHIDLPAEVISAALEGNTLPASVIGHGNDSRSSGRRSRRR
ncbi:hypothetical protein C8R42DRAFT_649391 [Lentinula raphanica]|nr:hypothetical protein C8R42DRAFT_649391 [Lentinula raphanica]